VTQAEFDALNKKNAQQKARLRPAFSVATWPDYDGRRFVAYGLNDAQVDALRKAALAAGIPEQQ
jgi:hypothetical protein